MSCSPIKKKNSCELYSNSRWYRENLQPNYCKTAGKIYLRIVHDVFFRNNPKHFFNVKLKKNLSWCYWCLKTRRQEKNL